MSIGSFAIGAAPLGGVPSHRARVATEIPVYLDRVFDALIRMSDPQMGDFYTRLSHTTIRSLSDRVDELLTMLPDLELSKILELAFALAYHVSP